MNSIVDKALKHCWEEIKSSGPDDEVNLFDFQLIAQIIRLNYIQEKMLQNIPGCKIGLNIVEYIEDNTFKDVPAHVIRNLTLDEFSDRMKTTAKVLQTKGYLSGGIFKTISVAFYVWYGCLSMAKLTRVMGSDGVLYTDQIRQERYSRLEQIWKEAEREENPWIRFGVTLAKCLEEKRKKADPTKVIVDDWIDKSSPYWECCNNE